MQKRKLGNEELILSFVSRIQNTTDEQFFDFQRENDEKRQIFIVSFQKFQIEPNFKD